MIDSSKYRLNENACLLQQIFTVWCANTDDEAIDLISNRSNHKIDIILMDLSSSDNTTGWGFLSQLWCNNDWKDIPVIILTEMNDITFNSPCWKVYLFVFILLFHFLSCRHDFDQVYFEDQN